MKTKHVFFVLLAMSFLAVACAPQQQATPNPDAIRQQIETSVAQTVDANNALTQAAQPAQPTQVPPTMISAPPTYTPFPTLTPFATITPFVITPGSSGGSGGSGGSGTSGTILGYPADLTCGDGVRYEAYIADQKPHDNSPETILKTDYGGGKSPDTVDVKFTFKNIGTKTWQPTWSWIVDGEEVNSDIPYNQGLSMSPVVFSSVLGTTVATNQTITLGAELTAPAHFEGTKPIYITVTFALVGDSGYKFCRPWIQFEIIRPGMLP